MRRHLSNLTVLLQLALCASGVVPAASSTASAQRMEQRFPRAVVSRALETFPADEPRAGPDGCVAPLEVRLLGGAIFGALVGEVVGVVVRAASGDLNRSTIKFVLVGAAVSATIAVVLPTPGVGCRGERRDIIGPAVPSRAGAGSLRHRQTLGGPDTEVSVRLRAG